MYKCILSDDAICWMGNTINGFILMSNGIFIGIYSMGNLQFSTII